MAIYQNWINPDGLKHIKAMSKAGYTNKEIGHVIGIKHRTFYYWINKYPEFEKALKDGRKPEPNNGKAEWVKELDEMGSDLHSVPSSKLIDFVAKHNPHYSKNPKPATETELEEEYKKARYQYGIIKRDLTFKIKYVKNLRDKLIINAFRTWDKRTPESKVKYYDTVELLDNEIRKLKEKRIAMDIEV